LHSRQGKESSKKVHYSQWMLAYLLWYLGPKRVQQKVFSGDKDGESIKRRIEKARQRSINKIRLE
jgi:hypothetical protein